MSVTYTAGYAAASAFSMDHARILWDALAFTAITSSGAADGHPADRVAVPDTSTWWESTVGSTARTLTMNFGALRAVDSVGIAGHNLGGDTIVIQGATNVGLTTWTTLATLTPSDDSSLLALFASANIYGIRFNITAASAAISTIISSVYAGVSLVMPVRGYGDLGPIDLGMEVGITSYRSETGQLAGRFVEYTGLTGNLMFTHLREPWVRSSLIPFIKRAITRPFFIATRPASYPTDCAYAWTVKNVIPQRMKMKNFMSVQMEVHAHAPNSLF